MRRKCEIERGQKHVFVLPTIERYLQTNIVSALECTGNSVFVLSASGGMQDPSALQCMHCQLHREG